MSFDKGRIQGFGSNGSNKTWQCPAGHLLQPWTAQPGTCDGCNARINKGDAVMDCRECNWYLCAACHPHEREQENALWSAFNCLMEVAAQEITEIAEEFQEMANEAETYVVEMIDSVSCVPSNTAQFAKEELDLSAQPKKQVKKEAEESCKNNTEESRENKAVAAAADAGEGVEKASATSAEAPKPPAEDLIDFGQNDLLDLDVVPTAAAPPKETAPAAAQASVEAPGDKAEGFDLLGVGGGTSPKATVAGAGADELLGLSSTPGPTLLHSTGAGIPAIPPPPSGTPICVA